MLTISNTWQIVQKILKKVKYIVERPGIVKVGLAAEI
jgi:hypothetical protein